MGGASPLLTWQSSLSWLSARPPDTHPGSLLLLEPSSTHPCSQRLQLPHSYYYSVRKENSLRSFSGLWFTNTNCMLGCGRSFHDNTRPEQPTNDATLVLWCKTLAGGPYYMSSLINCCFPYVPFTGVSRWCVKPRGAGVATGDVGPRCAPSGGVQRAQVLTG